MSALRKQDGFTLLELLISVTVLAIVTSQLFMVFSSQKRTFSANQRVLDVQEDARLVLDLIAFDARQAGFMVPRIAGVSSEDGGDSASDRFCISDPSYFAQPVVGTPTVLDSRSEHFNAATITNYTTSQITVTSADVDGSAALDGTNPDDFGGTTKGIIISDGQQSLCALIEGDSDGDPLTIKIDSDPDWGATGLNFVGNPAVRAAPAIIYEVDPATNTLTRNGMTLATSVEDFQVEYWVDNRTRNGAIDGAPADANTEFPIHDLNANPGWTIDTSRIRRVRVSVLTRTDMREVNPDGTEKIASPNSIRPAVANRDAATVADGFQRRRFVATVMPKNLE